MAIVVFLCVCVVRGRIIIYFFSSQYIPFCSIDFCSIAKYLTNGEPHNQHFLPHIESKKKEETLHKKKQFKRKNQMTHKRNTCITFKCYSKKREKERLCEYWHHKQIQMVIEKNQFQYIVIGEAQRGLQFFFLCKRIAH